MAQSFSKSSFFRNVGISPSVGVDLEAAVNEALTKVADVSADADRAVAAQAAAENAQRLTESASASALAEIQARRDAAISAIAASSASASSTISGLSNNATDASNRALASASAAEASKTAAVNAAASASTAASGASSSASAASVSAASANASQTASATSAAAAAASATSAQTSAAAASATLASYVKKAGDTMTGKLILSADGSYSMDAATTQQVERRAAAFADDRLAQAKAYSDGRLESRGAQIAQVYADDRLAQAKSYADGIGASASAVHVQALSGQWGGTFDIQTDWTNFFTVNLPARIRAVSGTAWLDVANTQPQVVAAISNVALMRPNGTEAARVQVGIARTGSGIGGTHAGSFAFSLGSDWDAGGYLLFQARKDQPVGPCYVYSCGLSAIAVTA